VGDDDVFSLHRLRNVYRILGEEVGSFMELGRLCQGKKNH